MFIISCFISQGTPHIPASGSVIPAIPGECNQMKRCLQAACADPCMHEQSRCMFETKHSGFCCSSHGFLIRFGKSKCVFKGFFCLQNIIFSIQQIKVLTNHHADPPLPVNTVLWWRRKSCRNPVPLLDLEASAALRSQQRRRARILCFLKKAERN